uniref:Uncharacterized protein n=1 Tax=Triticum urartu TaxID=4572 RepID=A0A8R7R3Z6_TRIUA
MELTFAGEDKFGCPCTFGGGLAAPPLLHEQALSAVAPSLLLSGRHGVEPLKHSNGAHIGILPLPFVGLPIHPLKIYSIKYVDLFILSAQEATHFGSEQYIIL